MNNEIEGYFEEDRDAWVERRIHYYLRAKSSELTDRVEGAQIRRFLRRFREEGVDAAGVAFHNGCVRLARTLAREDVARCTYDKERRWFTEPKQEEML